MNNLLKESFVFRPDVHTLHGIVVTTNHMGDLPLLRYADGKWIPDDGEYDLAFVKGVFAYGISLPQHSNLLWAWQDREATLKWFNSKALQRIAYDWHYYTVNSEKLIDWEERDEHPNEIAYRSAMDKCCSINSCANGRTIDLFHSDNHNQNIAYVKGTMEPIIKPNEPICYKCLNNGKLHILETMERYKDNLEGNLEELKERKNKAELDVYDCEHDINNTEEELKDITLDINNLLNFEVK